MNLIEMKYLNLKFRGVRIDEQPLDEYKADVERLSRSEIVYQISFPDSQNDVIVVRAEVPEAKIGDEVPFVLYAMFKDKTIKLINQDTLLEETKIGLN